MNERKGIMGKIIAISNHLPHPVTIPEFVSSNYNFI